MSAIFRSAAMTLLSKTLQTLLYKYLSDVDVEGVALPSLYNSDGHSGWGVRLSNVKLREGAKLMDLPGTKRRKRRRRRRKKPLRKGRKDDQKFSDKERGDFNSSQARLNVSVSALSLANEQQEPSTGEAVHPHEQPHNSQQQLLGNRNDSNDDNMDDDDPEVRVARAAALAAAAANASESATTKRKSWFGGYWYSSTSDEATHHDVQQPLADVSEHSQASKPAELLHVKENGMEEEEGVEDTVVQSSIDEDAVDDSGVASAVTENHPQPGDSSAEPYPSMTDADASLQADPRVAVLDAQSKNELSSSPRRRSWFGYFYSSMGPLDEQQAPEQLGPPPLLGMQRSADHNEASSSSFTERPSFVPSGSDEHVATTPKRRETAAASAAVGATKPEDTTVKASTLLYETPKRRTTATATSSSTIADPLLSPTRNSKTTTGLVEGATTIEEGDNEHDGGDNENDDDEDENDDYYEYVDVDDDDAEEQDSDDDTYEDFFEEVVAPMILRLGPAGRIGTLDIRLVGKDMHVLVEDADLLVEVVRPPTKKEDENNTSGSSGAESLSTPDKKSKGTEKKKPPATMSEPKTVGDRVMAENTIARLFSTIPNLLLRDIRVRLVVRDEDDAPQDGEQQARRMSDDAVLSQHEKSLSTASSGGSSRPTASSSKTVFEVCIELMSVTADGQDFFAHFRRDDEQDDSSQAMDAEEDELDESRNVVSTSGFDGDNQTIHENEYLTKRIRTGRGPDGGITIRAFPGGISDHFVSASRNDEWSRYTWLSLTEFCVLRCSGLDIHARMFMGTRKEDRHSASSVFWYSNDEYDADFSVDSMLFGVDYIAPGPQPPLPPIEEQTDLGTEEDGQLWMIPGATTYQMDANGIQSSRVGSSFHRFARGLLPTVSHGDHLPCEYCSKCWEAVPGTCLEHKLDDSAPMGGLVLSVSIRDRLEFNVDRPCLESIGLLLSLFTKKDPNEEEAKTEPDMEEDLDVESIAGLDISETSAGARSMSSRNNSSRGLKARASSCSLDQGGRHLRRNSKGGSVSGDQGSRPLSRSGSRSGSKSGSFAGDQEKGPPPKPKDVVAPTQTDKAVDTEETSEDDITNAFPSYMQPDKVQYVGVHLSEVVFRVHLMQERTVEDHRLSFRFWSILVKCLTIDHQQFVSRERSFQDLRCDFGHFSADEYRGVERKQLALLGLRQRVVDFDEITVETLMTREAECQRPPWPSTASVLLDLPPPVESLLYETRDRHAIQLRFVSIRENGATDFSRSSVHIKLGATFMDVPSNIGSQISTVVSEAKRSISGPPTSCDASTEAEKSEAKVNAPVDSLMKYRIQIDGARVTLQKLVDVRLPLTTFVGERSSTAGLSFQTVLEHLNLKYGNTATPSLFLDRRLSLEHLAELPENVRLRILLFLDNLNPLARAFGIKMEDENSFLLCGAINKAIIKLSRKVRRKSQTAGGEDPEGTSRRQEIMSELLRLDDDDLEDLLETHRRNQRRAARKKSNSNF